MNATKFIACAAAVVMLAGLRLATAAEPMSQLATLDAGVRTAEAVRAVKRLQNAYAHYLNDGLWSDAMELFVARPAAQFGEETLSGRDALRRAVMAQAGRNGNGLAKGQLYEHLVMQPIITLGADGLSAKGTWHELRMLGQYGKSASWSGGIYENEYALENGVWKIARLHYIPQYAGDYDDYGHKAPAKWNIPYHFEAKHVGVSVPQSAIDSLAREVGPSRSGPSYLALRDRAARLDDETAVQNLQHAFGYYLDRKMWADVADLFTADGSLSLANRGAYIGREHILKALALSFGPSPLRHGELFDHVMLDTVVTVAPDGLSASARTAQLGQLGLVGEFARWEVGVYENRFVKQDGKWKISAVNYYPRLSTDYDLGWKVDAAPAPGPDAKLPPDRKAAHRYASYPEQQAVPIDFANRGKARPSADLGDSHAVTAGELAALQRQVHNAIAVDAVENLMSSYGYYIDESAWDEMADTFGSKGSKEITGAGVYVGTERIRAILKLRGPAGGRTANFFTIHQLVQPVIHVADDGLSARARLRLFQDGGAADGSSGSWIGGTYENTALFENGEWKFGVQDLHHSYNASYRNGWARVGPGVSQLKDRAPSARDQRGGGITQGLGGARSGNRLVDEMPPDAPIRARQYSFPEIVEPAFHYANPVSGRAAPEYVHGP